MMVRRFETVIRSVAPSLFWGDLALAPEAEEGPNAAESR